MSDLINKKTIRMFLLEGRSYLVLCIFALVASSITYVLYKYTEDLLKIRLQERLTAIVATAAVQFDATEINKINGPDDLKSAQLEHVVSQLAAIRSANENIKFAYIMRRSTDPLVFSFVADADVLSPSTALDKNLNGVIDDSEQPPLSGDPYPI